MGRSLGRESRKLAPVPLTAMTLGKPPALSKLSLPIQKMGLLPKMSSWPAHVQTSQNPVGLPEPPSSPVPRQVMLGMTILTALGTAPCRARPLQPGSLGSNRGPALPSCAPLDESLHLPSLSIPISEMGTVANAWTSELDAKCLQSTPQALSYRWALPLPLPRS